MCLIPCYAFIVNLKFVTNFFIITNSVINLNQNIIVSMLVLDVFLYFLLFIYLDQVVPNEFGIKKHPLFFIKCLFKSKKLDTKSLIKMSTNSYSLAGNDIQFLEKQ